MEQNEPVREALPDERVQTFLLPDTTRTLFWMGCSVAILSSAEMTAEDLAFAVWDLGEAHTVYLQKLMDLCGRCDALCACRAAKQEETDALCRLPLALLETLRKEGVCIQNFGKALASGTILYDACAEKKGV